MNEPCCDELRSFLDAWGTNEQTPSIILATDESGIYYEVQILDDWYYHAITLRFCPFCGQGQ